MQSSIPNISGQWLGHFKYGPEYGDLYGEKVEFSFVLENLEEGQFQGKCFELEGIGVNPNVALIKGYVDGNTIHFTKEYPVNYQFEDDGNISESKLTTKLILTYDGEYDYRIQAYVGKWELEANLGPTIHGDLLDICSGTWEMSKCK